MLGFYNYTVVLTYMGMLISFLGITSALNDGIYLSLVCLMLSGVCDMFDGKIASTMDRNSREKSFGIQIDSLSDLICFGMLPAIIVFKISAPGRSAIYICSLYLLAALIRLAYFNVEEEERQRTTTDDRRVYLGLPVTSVALFLPLFLCFASFFSLPGDKIGKVVLSIMAIAFLTPFPLKKPKIRGKIALILCGCAELFLIVKTRGL